MTLPAVRQEPTVDRYLWKLDAEFARCGIRAERDAAEIAESLRGWTSRHWAEFAVLNGVEPPDAVLRGMLIDRYEQRAERERLVSDVEPIFSGDRDTRGAA